MIGQYCKEYRNKHYATLKEIGGEENVKILSAFEHGRSSNIRHLVPYILLAEKHGEKEEFLSGLCEAL